MSITKFNKDVVRFDFEPSDDFAFRSEERRVGKSVDLGGRRIIKKRFFSSRRRHTR